MSDSANPNSPGPEGENAQRRGPVFRRIPLRGGETRPRCISYAPGHKILLGRLERAHAGTWAPASVLGVDGQFVTMGTNEGVDRRWTHDVVGLHLMAEKILFEPETRCEWSEAESILWIRWQGAVFFLSLDDGAPTPCRFDLSDDEWDPYS